MVKVKSENEKVKGNMPVGKTLGNVGAYIVSFINENPVLQPIGAKGELCFSGIEQRDYLGEDKIVELIENPFSEDAAHKTLYRTGDLAVRLSDGSINFLGPENDSVKVQIENLLLSHYGIKEAVVVERGREPKIYRTAYFESFKVIDTDKLKKKLSMVLPGYMIPDFFVQLEQIPLTPDGKVDYDELLALPTIDSLLAEIEADVLHINKEDIDLDADFFKAGGDSFKASKVAAKIHKAFNVKVSMAEIFKRPTLRQLAKYLNECIKVKYEYIRSAEPKEYYPMSSVQRRLYFLHQLENKEDKTTYNIQMMDIYCKGFDKDKLEDAFKALIKRHESLRTSFHIIDGEPYQKIHDYRESGSEFAIEYYETDEEGKIHTWEPGKQPTGDEPSGGKDFQEVIKSFVRPFDLGKPSLLRVGFIKILHNTKILMLDMHHIVADGISLEILAKELWELYDDNELPPLRLQYKDFSEWLNSEEQTAAIKEQESFWLGEFDGEIPMINLPTDYPRPAKLTFDGDTVPFVIDALEALQLNAIAEDHGESLYMVLFAAFNVLLARVTGQEDIVIGTVTAGRGHPDLEQIVGMFLNTLALRSYPEGEKTFESFMAEVKLTAFAAFEHQDYPFDDLARKVAPRVDASRNPLFDVVFGLENEADPTGYLMEVAVPDKAKPYDFGVKKAKFDMTMICVETEAGIEGSIEYKTKLFNRGTIQRFTGYFKKIVSSICGDVTQKISQIDMLPEDERKIILDEFNNMTTEYPSDKTIHEIFEEHVEKNPENPALMLNDLKFTYRELNEKCNRLAAVLRDNGVRPNTIVALMTGRTMELIIAQLGILKAGGAYLSIDIELPDARKQFLLQDSNADMLLVRGEYLEENEAELQALFGKQIIAIDDEAVYAGVTDVSNQSTASGPDDLAYVIYTSGTTGKPKGVMMHHRGIASLNVCTRERFELDENSRVLQFATVSFDASVWEVWMALMNGAALVLVETDTIQNYERFIDYINDKGITITLLPPIYVGHIDPVAVKTFKTLLTGGAAAGSEMVEKWRRHVQYVNCYGPTEASICCTMWKASQTGAPVTNPPIGIPVDNTNIHIVDKNMNLVPIGVSGELCVSGIHVATGYLNRPELTDEKFIDDPILEGNRMYRTGDLVRWLPNGLIEYSGRIDFQVKIRGFRIEPGEIENCIARHDSIKDAAVLALDNKVTKEKFLCAYFVPHDSMDLDELKDYLHEELPEYMVPSYFVQVNVIPLTPSGKVDKKQLPEPEIGGAAEGYEAPRNDIERRTADAWAVVLGLEQVGIEDDFFTLGGDSIKAIQIISRLQKDGLILEVSQLFLHKTIKQLGRHIKPIEDDPVKKVDQEMVTGSVRLTPIEEWFFKEQDEHARSHFNQYMLFVGRPKKNPPGTPKTGEPQEGGYDKHHIGEVFKKIMEHHDALRMVFAFDGDNVVQENRGAPANETFDWVAVDLENIADNPRLKEEKAFYLHDLKDEDRETEHIDAIAAQVHKSFDLEKGPLLKLCLFKGMRVDYLLVVVHHLVVDGISWRILMDDFEAGYNQAVKGEEIRFSDKTHSFQYWAEELNKYAVSGGLLKEFDYWRTIENTAVESLPVDCRIERRVFGDYPHAVRELSQDKAEAKEYTRKLKEDVRRAYQTEINDILLTAVGLAVRVWAWKDKKNHADISDVLVTLEGHGREKVVDVDITRTVGWYSTQYPVILDMAPPEGGDVTTSVLDGVWTAMDDVSDKGHSFQDYVLKMAPELKKNFDRYISYAVRKVKETLRRVPNKGIGYGILKYLTPPEKKENFQFQRAPEIVFNYLGEFSGFDYDYIDQIKGLTDMDFKMSWSDDLKFGHKLDIESIIVDGELKLYMFYNEKEYVLGKEKNYGGEPDRVKDLLNLIKAILLAVIDHCAGQTVTRLTPHDLGCGKLSVTGLDRVAGDVRARISKDMDIESIYPLTAFQAEMFRAVSANREAYLVQNMFAVPASADTKLLEDSFNVIIDRFQVMRTVYMDAGADVFIAGVSPEPLQIVLKKRTLEIEVKDIAHLSGDEQQQEIERVKAADKETGFDLTAQLPLRVTLFKTGDAFDKLLWSQNHISIDGWCLGVIISDLLDAYDGLKANSSIAFDPVYPYKDYIDWLEQADMAEGAEYHREYLAGYKQGAALASLGNTVETGRFKLVDYYLTLDEAVTEGLNRTASKAGVTLNTLFQVLWGVLLQRRTGSGDVLFGAIVSGRSAELEGIDTIAGLFINVVPVRIKSGETTTFSELAAERQEQSARSKKFEYFPLPEALAQAGSSADGGPVVDNLMFFENFPLDEENRNMFSGSKTSGLKIEWIENREQIDYSFNFYVIPGKSTTVRFSYNSLVYGDEFIKKTASDVEGIIKQVIGNPEIAVKDITC